jgi:geranylgeranyl reductase family protein
MPPFPTAPADWNHPLDSAPERCEVLVVGAGPAGSACARVLAQAGRGVLLVDAQAFPRDKVCGDGLVPDAHAALRRLGVHDRVMRRARPAVAAQCVAPSGRAVSVPGELAVLPRRELDALLCQAAVEVGARMVAPARFLAPLRDGAGRVCGARLAHAGQTRDIHCDWLVLATGAVPAAILAAGLCERRTPSAMALRAYVHHPTLGEAVPNPRFVWHRRMPGGYGWIFPAPGGVYNIGVGVLDRHGLSADGADGRSRKARNLRTMLDQFVAVDPWARRLMHEGNVLGEVKGAPLRCDLTGTRPSAAGVLATGEAIGTTYALTGEGIGKALETGIAAAESLLAGGTDAAVQAAYATQLEALKPRFEMYRKAGSFNRHPTLVSLVVWRASHSARIIARLSDILNEHRLPGSLLSWRGFKRILLG